MEKQTITELLDRLGNLQDAVEVMRIDQEQKRAAIMQPVAQALADLDDEYRPALDGAQASIAELQTQVKAAVVEAGESVKGARLQAVYVKGRVSWDTKRLDGFAAAHPEILSFRKEGEPSVTLRTV